MATTTTQQQGERFREMRSGVVQATFVAFPGYEPTYSGGWPTILQLPWWRGHTDAAEDEDENDVMDVLVDPLLEKHPEVFGLTGEGDYQDYNDLSIGLANEIGCALEPVVDRVRIRQPDQGRAFADWYEDIDLDNGVIVRVAFFRDR